MNSYFGAIVWQIHWFHLKEYDQSPGGLVPAFHPCIYIFLLFSSENWYFWSRRGSAVVLRLLVRGGSRDRRFCSGRRRRWSPCHTAGSKNRSREKDDSVGGRIVATAGAVATNFTHHSTTEQSSSTRERNFESGAAGAGHTGELGSFSCISFKMLNLSK